eukprot:m.1384939 g.1384939  ORF g.1384939 m.1384939 type:complete len:204 (+) comp24975_c1_seq27:3285-3896(+)
MCLRGVQRCMGCRTQSSTCVDAAKTVLRLERSVAFDLGRLGGAAERAVGWTAACPTRATALSKREGTSICDQSGEAAPEADVWDDRCSSTTASACALVVDEHASDEVDEAKDKQNDDENISTRNLLARLVHSGTWAWTWAWTWGWNDRSPIVREHDATIIRRENVLDVAAGQHGGVSANRTQRPLLREPPRTTSAVYFTFSLH